ncbi:hypothetical protein BSLG_007808 [Batrachochytrium salamandrivorans]|nr:hypothetical protein BSLG_007808 [Batrachochytrium salamandrivorans]
MSMADGETGKQLWESKDWLASSQIEPADIGIKEEWHFEFGFVIPGSTNTWNMVTEAASPEDMLPIELISGSLITDTQLMDGDKVLHHSKLRLFYV